MDEVMLGLWEAKRTVKVSPAAGRVQTANLSRYAPGVQVPQSPDWRPRRNARVQVRMHVWYLEIASYSIAT